VNAGGQLGNFTPTRLTGGPAAGLVKAGPGFLFLGQTSYGGTTTVNGGVLLETAPVSTPTVVNTGGTLAGSPDGAVGNVTVAGGKLSPGFETPVFPQGAGVVESSGAVAFNASSTYHVDIAGTDAASFQLDQLLISGAGTVNLGNAKLDVSFLPNFQSAVG